MTDREIGSDFESVCSTWLMSSPATSVPWLQEGETVTYLESGRQALTLLSQYLRREGLNTIFFPSHYCDSMLGPFLSEGWDIQLVDVLDDWTLESKALRGVRNFQEAAIFSIALFGMPESPAWLDSLAVASHQGATVISDETHRIWGSGLEVADFRVASLRKLLPLPDGAFIVGPIEPTTRGGSASAAMRAAAMRTKDSYLKGARVDHRPMFASAEASLAAQLQPRAMSDQSVDLLSRLDYQGMARRRVDNHEILTRGWSRDSGIVTTSAAPVPSHCVIRTTQVKQLRHHLVAHGVYPPIHWPAPPADWPHAGRWKDDVLSLPIDHRYGSDDMQRILGLLTH